jgi:hypothetical protein
MAKSRMIRLAGHLVSMRREEKHIRNIFLGSLKERDHSEDLYINGRIILKWMLIKEHGSVCTFSNNGTDGRFL